MTRLPHNPGRSTTRSAGAEEGGLGKGLPTSGERTTLWAQALTLPLEKGRGGGSQPASLESPSLEMTFIVPVEGDQSCRSEMKHISPTDVSGPCVGSLGLMLQVGVVLHPHGPSGDGAAAAFQCCRARGCR